VAFYIISVERSVGKMQRTQKYKISPICVYPKGRNSIVINAKDMLVYGKNKLFVAFVNYSTPHPSQLSKPLPSTERRKGGSHYGCVS
jgi:hypothetical protein